MAVIAIASFKGSPGVTTTALALGAVWPRATGRCAVVVEADPSGGDLAYRAITPQGRPPADTPNLVTLAAGVRKHVQQAERARGVVAVHSQRLACGAAVVLGMGTQVQARGLAALWQPLADAFARSADDVLLDLGRLDPAHPAFVLARSADLVVLVLTASMGSVLHARNNMASMASGLAGRPTGPAICPVLVGPRQSALRDAVEVTELLVGSGAPLHPVMTLADDARAVAALVDSALTPRLARSTLLRSVSDVAVQLADRLPPAARDHRINTTQPGVSR
ncbi:hypothetical protein RDV89_17455 [Nocardioides zeae]|uniref:MinD-like ATPase involved in chromosome partitioning or flagellar assembly n=1 Tax=Nocardioides imazamoxiresistens TaxID=3231893 RepID=A0ABU3Q085_9ACTN|nr:hypothetical protein [Nocardioides zeae]MDT9594879.1 hypothetical protein [Nocardioides zeae]